MPSYKWLDASWKPGPGIEALAAVNEGCRGCFGGEGQR